MIELLGLIEPSSILGISGLIDDLIDNWIWPVFLLLVAVFSVVFIKDRAWIKLASFFAIAAIVGIFIYNADSWFGGEGHATTTVEKYGRQIK